MRVAVVGCGSIGFRHMGNILALSAAGELPEPVQCLAVDADQGSRERAASAHGVRTMDDFAAALDAGLDAAFICTPSNSHLALAAMAAKRGCHLFIEKPLALDTRGVAALEEILEGTGKTCMVACNMSFHPPVAHVRRILESGEVGAPRIFRSYWGHHVEQWFPGGLAQAHYSLDPARGGGCLFDVGAHEFFYVPEMLGRVERMDCLKGPSGFLPSEVDDYVHITARLENGVSGTFSFNFLDRCRRRSLEVVCERGTIIWSSQGKNPMRDSLVVLKGNTELIELPCEPDPQVMYRETVRHFFDCVAGADTPRQTLAQAAEVVDCINELHSHGTFQR